MGKSLLPSETIRPLSQNRRRGRRHLLDIPATLFGGSSKNAELPVKIVEFSMHGLGMRSERPFGAGEIYEVRAFDTLVKPGMQIKIISSRALADGGFIIGGEVV